jgi:hypothetical protein
MQPVVVRREKDLGFDKRLAHQSLKRARSQLA